MTGRFSSVHPIWRVRSEEIHPRLPKIPAQHAVWKRDISALNVKTEMSPLDATYVICPYLSWCLDYVLQCLRSSKDLLQCLLEISFRNQSASLLFIRGHSVYKVPTLISHSPEVPHNVKAYDYTPSTWCKSTRRHLSDILYPGSFANIDVSIYHYHKWTQMESGTVFLKRGFLKELLPVLIINPSREQPSPTLA